MGNMNVNGTGFSIIFVSPHFVQQLLARKNQVHVIDEGDQQVEFLYSQSNRIFVYGSDTPPGSIQTLPKDLRPLSESCPELDTRRRIARTRATNSRGLNGLVM